MPRSKYDSTDALVPETPDGYRGPTLRLPDARRVYLFYPEDADE